MKKIYALFAAALMTVSLSAATIYCKMTQEWWTKDGAAVGIYYWGVNGAPNWPGYRMTSVGDGVWSYDLPADVKVVIFSRVNNSGDVADWGAQTKNLDVPTDGKNLFTITTSSPTWGGNPGCEGEWSVYDGQGGGQGGQGGGDTPGGQGGGSTVEGNPRYYYKGYIDGADVEPGEETLFDHGLAELEVAQNAYIFVLYQVDGQPGVQYMTASYVDGPTHATFIKTDGGDKIHIGAGSYTLYLYDNEDGTLELSTQPIPGKKLADPQPVHQSIEETGVTLKAHKVIIDGQLRIIRGDKMFDVTGRQIE